MICKTITYRDFRNIEEGTLTCSPGVTILYGKNAQGKTNMLEGVYMFAQGKSHRARVESELIRFGADAAYISMKYRSDKSADFVGAGESHAHSESELSMSIERGHRKTPYKNGVRLDRMSEMIGNFRAVLFSPEHLSIVKGAPSERRSFLDVAISQLRPVYVRTLQRYNAILLQRNALLKSAARRGARPDAVLLESWSEQLSEYAAKIAVIRAGYADKLSDIASELYADMTGKREDIKISYHGTSRIGGDYGDEERVRDIYRRQLTENTEREIMLGATQYGIHKDDVDIFIDGKEAKLYASQGQQRSIVLVLKLSEGEYSRRQTGEYPVLLLDDVLSELDTQRRAYVMGGIKDRQVIITSCDMSARRRVKDCVCYSVRNGKWSET